MKHEVPAKMAHEVNNPLAIVKGKLDMLRRLVSTDRFDRAKFEAELEKVEAALQRLVNIIPGFEGRVWNDLNSFPEGDGRVLVIEDEADLADALKFFLAEAGIEAVTCSNGAEALKHLKLEKFGVVLCDYRLPDMQGNEVLGEVGSPGTELEFAL